MIVWPQSLIREIAARRCIFFLGAGISASAKDQNGRSPKTWAEFLNSAAQLIPNTTTRSVVSKLIDQCNYLLALQGIKDAVDPGEYRDLLDSNFNNPNFNPGVLHRLINELDARVVITTNFDKVYEKHCLSTGSNGAFKVINYYSKDICDELRSDTRLIVKAHGTIDEIRQMIFTRAEYHEARRSYPNFYEVLKALFLTNTVIFMGCGLQDPDVLLLLEDVKIVSSSQRPHYLVTIDREHASPLVSDWLNTYNVKPLFFGPTFDDLITDLEELVSSVEDERALTRVG